MLIRAAIASDAEAIAVSEFASFPDDAWTQTYAEAVIAGELPTLSLLVAEVDGALVGHAIVSVVFEDAELQRIATVPSYRRQGIGGHLLAGVIDHARAGGAERLLLEVREANVAARELYLVAGFVELAIRKGYYHDGESAVVMELGL